MTASHAGDRSLRFTQRRGLGSRELKTWVYLSVVFDGVEEQFPLEPAQDHDMYSSLL